MKKGVKQKIIPREKLTIDDLVLSTTKDKKVGKVIFSTNVGDISWRANVEKDDYQEVNGFTIDRKTRQKPGFDELPGIMYELRDQLKKGPVAVETSYKQWQHDDRMSYTFNDTQINEMEIIGNYAKKRKGKKKR